MFPSPNLRRIAALGALILAAPAASALAQVSLFEYGFNIDGVVEPPGSLGASLNDGGFNYSTGLGTISLSLGGAGSHFFGVYVDHEIDEPINTFFNEFGTPVNSPSATQTWEIDEPGFLFGDIFTHFNGSTAAASLLDNSNGVPQATPDDVSMAMGWNINLTAGQTATVTFLLSQNAPTGGFYLQHTDPDSDVSIYFSSSTRITGGGGGSGAPEGGTTASLLIASLVALGYFHRRQINCRA